MDGAGTNLLPGSPEGDRPRGAGYDAPAEATPATLTLLAIVGPTGTGKSELAFELARRLCGEIVSCDAVQVYRGLDAATAKPPPEYRRQVPHHLVDHVDPRTDYSLASFVADAERAVREIGSRGATPILAGGTGLYLRGLLRGVIEAPPRDAGLRDRLRGIATRRGAAVLHRFLARLDPVSAQRIPPADTQRIVRAIEFAILAGEPWSARLREQGTWARREERYRCVKIGLRLERAELYARIDDRVDQFFARGLVEEVERLRLRGVPDRANAFKAIGYREVLAAWIEGRDPRGVADEVKRSTRRYAKRQMSWFRHEPAIAWLDVAAGRRALVDEALALWQEAAAAGESSTA